MAARLRDILFQLNDVEREQKKYGGNVNFMELDYINHPIPQMPRWDFFKDGDIAVNKNNRFSYVPAHTHNFIELNYMYSGSCTQYINDEKIVLHTGDLILMDKDIVQRIDYTGENDVLVNILLKDDSIINQLFDYIEESANIVTQFLYNASKINSIHNNFILFNLTKNLVGTRLIESLILKGVSQDKRRNQSLKLILSALLIELSQSIEKEAINFTDTSNDEFLPIVKYIDENFATISLENVSQKFGYNTNYLGNKIKETTGKTFKELIERRRLAAAQNLMLKTHCSMDEICEVIGFKNSSSLFRLFKKSLNTTPAAYKKKVSPKSYPSEKRTVFPK